MNEIETTVDVILGEGGSMEDGHRSFKAGNSDAAFVCKPAMELESRLLRFCI